MPKATDDEKARRVEEKRAQKRARGSIACAECRRLKLKCDRTVPCSSCTRRGCESICPNGQLVHGQGKMLLADTEQLHEKIRVMSARIRSLEDALQTLHSRFTRQTHPLLTADQLNVKSTLEIPEVTSPHRSPSEPQEVLAHTDAIGTLVDSNAGAPAFFGTSASAENYLAEAGNDAMEAPVKGERSGLHHTLSDVPDSKLNYPEGTAEPSRLSPLSLTDAAPSRKYDIIHSKLPPWPRARQLCDIYLSYRTWAFGAVSHQQLNRELLPLFYAEAGGENAARNSHATAMVHRLGLMFGVLALGAFLDTALPLAPHNDEGRHYSHLMRAVVELAPFLDTPPSVSTIQLVLTSAACLVMGGDDDPIGTAWRYLGLAMRLGQSIGLHLDGTHWNLGSEEIERRRTLFFDLLMEDFWISMSTGRIPSFPCGGFDVNLPEQRIVMRQDGGVGFDLPVWKARFTKDSLCAVASFLSTGTSKYSAVLELDEKLVKLALPDWSRGEPKEGSGLIQTMYHYAPMNCREHARLYLHRRFFAQAIVDDAEEPQRSPFGRSFIAAYEGTRAIISLHAKQCELFPNEMARLFGAWSNPFCAVIMLAAVLMLSPNCTIAESAREELRLGYDMFERGATFGGRAASLFPTVQKMYHKALHKYDDARRGGTSSPPRSDSPPNEAQVMLGMVPTAPRLRSTTSSPTLPNSRFSESDVRSQPAPLPQLPVFAHGPGAPGYTTQDMGPGMFGVPQGATSEILQPNMPLQNAMTWGVEGGHTAQAQELVQADLTGGADWYMQMTDTWTSFVQQLELPPEHQDLLSFPPYDGFY